jgi:hypothetical protein
MAPAFEFSRAATGTAGGVGVGVAAGVGDVVVTGDVFGGGGGSATGSSVEHPAARSAPATMPASQPSPDTGILSVQPPTPGAKLSGPDSQRQPWKVKSVDEAQPCGASPDSSQEGRTWFIGSDSRQISDRAEAASAKPTKLLRLRTEGSNFVGDARVTRHRMRNQTAAAATSTPRHRIRPPSRRRALRTLVPKLHPAGRHRCHMPTNGWVRHEASVATGAPSPTRCSRPANARRCRERRAHKPALPRNNASDVTRIPDARGFATIPRRSSTPAWPGCGEVVPAGPSYAQTHRRGHGMARRRRRRQSR